MNESKKPMPLKRQAVIAKLTPKVVSAGEVASMSWDYEIACNQPRRMLLEAWASRGNDLSA